MQSNAELINKALSGDSSAFAMLVERYERLVWTVCWQVLRDYHLTQDTTQDVFFVAYHRLKGLRQPDSLGSWITAIARREALRARQSRLRDATCGLHEESVVATPQIGTQHEGLIDAIAELPEHERLVTVLRYLNGHSVAEVSSLTGRPVGTVTKQLSRALARLKTKLSRMEEYMLASERGD